MSSVEIDQGNTSRPQIALTFDAGGPATPTAQILDILAKYHLHVTWFVTGDWARGNFDLLRRVHNDGHEIGNHTMTHPDLTTLPNALQLHFLHRSRKASSLLSFPETTVDSTAGA